MAWFQSLTGPTSHSNDAGLLNYGMYSGGVSIPNGPHKPFQRNAQGNFAGYAKWFQSLTGPTSHSNDAHHRSSAWYYHGFQSLTGPTSHSNGEYFDLGRGTGHRFNP